jgi:hypothetical protein
MILATAVVIYESVVSAWLPVVVTLGIFAVGFPYWFLYLKPRSADRWTLPEAADEEIGEYHQSPLTKCAENSSTTLRGASLPKNRR